MFGDTMRSFEIPGEIRAAAERNVEQARLAFSDYAKAAKEAFSIFDYWVTESQASAQGFSRMAIGFAQRNGQSAFDFAHKIVQAKDINELIQLQTAFVQSHIQALTGQLKALGEKTAQAAAVRAPDSGKIAEAA
jgi:hypothetical protein